jgi:hypothetical protein
MGLGNRQDTGYSLRTELVKRLTYYVGTDVFGGLEHRIADIFKVVKKLGVTFFQFQQNMLS